MSLFKNLPRLNKFVSCKNKHGSVQEKGILNGFRRILTSWHLRSYLESAELSIFENFFVYILVASDKMQEFLLNIDNKEILIEILHHAIDYLIGDHNSDSLLPKLCHKYGFQCPDDFMMTIKSIAKTYKLHCIEGDSEAELLASFANMNPDLQQMVTRVLSARKTEIIKHLIREHNARDQPLVVSFDWDVRLIMGDSSLAENRREIVAVTLDCLDSTGKIEKLHFQMDPSKLDQFIEVLDKAIKSDALKNNASNDAIKSTYEYVL